MLKRNGEDCEHPVPNYPGLLTASEYKAYQAAVPLVAEQVRLHNERIKLLAEIESQSAQIVEKIAGTKEGHLIGNWTLRHTLFKSARGEMAVCSRGEGQKLEYGILERFDPNSALARARGDTEEIMRGNNAYLVLQNFVESERGVLQLYRQDIKATVEQKLTEMFPKLNVTRVVRAISASCVVDQTTVEAEKQKPAQTARIKM